MSFWSSSSKGDDEAFKTVGGVTLGVESACTGMFGCAVGRAIPIPVSSSSLSSGDLRHSDASADLHVVSRYRLSPRLPLHIAQYTFELIYYINEEHQLLYGQRT